MDLEIQGYHPSDLGKYSFNGVRATELTMRQPEEWEWRMICKADTTVSDVAVKW